VDNKNQINTYKDLIVWQKSTDFVVGDTNRDSKRLPFSKDINFVKVDNLLNEIMRMLNKILSILKS
jgi:hypothetical protein